MKFSMASAFGGSFAMLRKGFVPLLLVTIAIFIVPNLLLTLGMTRLFKVPYGTLQAWQGNYMPVTLGLSLILYFLAFVHISAVTEIAVLSGSDKPVKLGDVLRHGAVNAVPIFVIYLLCTLGWLLGLVLLIVPAFIFGTIFSVVVPAYVTEKPGIFGAFSRAAKLSEGHRWGIFGMWLLILFVVYIVMGTIEFTLLMPYIQQTIRAASTGVAAPPPVFSFITMAILSVAGGLVSVILFVFNAGFYAALRAEKDQFSGARLDKVFE